MARYFRIAIELDGHRRTGEWTLLMGGRVRARALGYIPATVEIGDEPPQAAAKRALEQVFRDAARRDAEWAEHQAEQMAELHRRRLETAASLAAQLAGEPDPIREALRRFIEQAERCGFKDPLGHPLEMNAAYIEVRELLRGYDDGA